MFAWHLLGLEEWTKKLKTSCDRGTEDTTSVWHLSMFTLHMLSDHFPYHGTVARWQVCYRKHLDRFTINVK
jgi:hypothetical protein